MTETAGKGFNQLAINKVQFVIKLAYYNEKRGLMPLFEYLTYNALNFHIHV